jgi:hypothetical protein
MEASLIQHAAYGTVEHPDESNPFLFHMFASGYDAWSGEKRASDHSFLGELGIDAERLATMTMDEVDEWLAAQANDPSKKKAMELFFQKHPDLQQESAANLQALEGSSTKLLEREDCQFLLLSAQEVDPWLRRLSENLAESRLNQDRATSEEAAHRLFEDAVLPLLRKMTDSIFSRDRINEMISSLRRYRSEKFAAGEKEIALTATGAIGYLEREDQPGVNSFLISLCWASLSRIIAKGADETVAVMRK